MWWGIAVEAPDPLALATFYSDLLDWPLVGDDDGSLILAAPEGRIYLVLQPAEDYEPPTWPPEPGSQRPMLHLDFQVGDLDAAVSEAVALGARIADKQPNSSVRVLLDPAGHPFCLSAND
jgi:catechol 2,3-dioxygenase-like lactoylglutathione lyase family enzyme